MRVALIALAIGILSGSSATAATPSPPSSGQADAFVPWGGLRVQVDFWISIYSKYSTREGVVHDSKYIDKIYEVLDDPKKAKAAKRKWREVLLSVHRKLSKGKDADLSEDEKRVVELFKDVGEPDKFLDAAHRKRLRFQLGQKDRFVEGLKASGRYLSRMEDIFRREGLPVELTRLPFVESSFDLRARSKVGASGVWQFMRSTGKHFLRINDAVDERNDPILATEAAAKLLKLNYEALGNWPLAVTAYNHGRQGMMRAVRKVSSDDLNEVIRSYRSRTFGFASGNFFACLLAAIEIERNVDRYFGEVQRDPLMEFYEVALPHYVDLGRLAHFLRLEIDGLRSLNPGLSEGVFSGKMRVPAKYRLKLPLGRESAEEATKVFFAGYSEIPGVYKFKSQGARR